MVSIIIRTRNESKYIGLCLRSIKNQIYQNFELILVDNNSNDSTVEIALSIFPKLKLVKYTKEEYFPGEALNYGANAAKGEILVFLSAHCIPYNNEWLTNLIKPFEIDNNIVGVYGRQIPMISSKPENIRDLFITFSNEDKIQRKDSFFHNANSAIKRDIWLKNNFSCTATNIEDRIWADTIISKNYFIYYSSKSIVFHHHGIHQYGNNSRLNKTIETIRNFKNIHLINEKIDLTNVKSVVFIPIFKFYTQSNKNIYDIEKTIDFFEKFDFITDIYLYTNINPPNIINKFSKVRVLNRPKFYDKNNISTFDILKSFKKELFNKKIFPDIFIYVEEKERDRSNLNFKNILENFVNSDFDAFVPVKEIYDFILQKNTDNDTYSIVNNGFQPSILGSNFYFADKGLFTLFYSNSIDNEIANLQFGTIKI